MHYRLGTISLAATTLLLSLIPICFDFDAYSLIAPPDSWGVGGVPNVTLEKPIGITSPVLPIDGFEPLAAQAQTTQDRKTEGDRLFQQAYQQFQQKQYEAAIESLQQALTIYRAISDLPNGDSLASRQQEAEVLFRLGDTYKQVAPSVEPTNQSGWGLVKDYSKAIEFYQQALAVYRAIGERNKEAEVLISLGNAYKSGKLKSYPKVIEYYQQALAIYQALGERKKEAQGFIEIGSIYQLMEDYPKAIASYQ